MSKKLVAALITAVALAFPMVGAFAQTVPARGTTRITPNRLTVSWEDNSKTPVTINTFRMHGYNVAQLRTMVAVLGGTVDNLADNTYQLRVDTERNVPFTEIELREAQDVEYIMNTTRIRDVYGTLRSPSQPGWVFLPRYEYNWASVRDIAGSMEVELVSVNDYPDRGLTEVVVKSNLQPEAPRLPYGWAAPRAPGSWSPGWAGPYLTATPTPMVTPTVTPMVTPTVTPIVTPTVTPTITPTATPTVTPTPTITQPPSFTIPVNVANHTMTVSAAIGNQANFNLQINGVEDTANITSILIQYFNESQSMSVPIATWSWREPANQLNVAQVANVANNIFTVASSNPWSIEAGHSYEFVVQVSGASPSTRRTLVRIEGNDLTAQEQEVDSGPITNQVLNVRASAMTPNQNFSFKLPVAADVSTVSIVATYNTNANVEVDEWRYGPGEPGNVTNLGSDTFQIAHPSGSWQFASGHYYMFMVNFTGTDGIEREIGIRVYIN